ncbi:MAG: hypothetical protein V1749_00290 [Candidatus Desantisbacteria bacterium]
MEWLAITVLIVFMLGLGIVTYDTIKHAKKTSMSNNLSQPIIKGIS